VGGKSDERKFSASSEALHRRARASRRIPLADAAATPPKVKAKAMELAMERPDQGPARQVISAWMVLTMVAVAAFLVSVI